MKLPSLKTLLKKQLQQSPELLANYVSVGTKLARIAALPVKKVLEHLLLVQDISLSTQPGEREREHFNKLFDVFHTEDYDSDFDFSWAKKSMKLSREKMNAPQMDYNLYRQITDLSDSRDRDIDPYESETVDDFFKVSEPPAPPAEALSAQEEVEVALKVCESLLDLKNEDSSVDPYEDPHKVVFPEKSVDDLVKEAMERVANRKALLEGQSVLEKEANPVFERLAHKYNWSRKGPQGPRPQSYYDPYKKSVFKRVVQNKK